MLVERVDLIVVAVHARINVQHWHEMWAGQSDHDWHIVASFGSYRSRNHASHRVTNEHDAFLPAVQRLYLFNRFVDKLFLLEKLGASERRQLFV